MRYFTFALLFATLLSKSQQQSTMEELINRSADIISPIFSNMWNFRYEEKPIKASYDFIIVGAGNAGCVLANRLSEDLNVTVLLLEAGQAEMPLFTDIPISAPNFYSTSYNYGYVTEPQKKACLGLVDQRCGFPHGRGLGGSSLINYMIYTRGNKHDYDSWSAAGNPGWSYQEILPYYKKIESAKIRDFDQNGFHGSEGPVSVEDCPFRTPISHAFIKSAQVAGYPYNDYNSDKQLGVSYLQAHTKNGWRVTSANAYLEPIAHARRNLHIMPNSRVKRVIINRKTKTAKGVEFLSQGKTFYVKAQREVILSAGSIESPKLLMLSGVGPKTDLQQLAGVKFIKDLPVGKTLYDHIGVLGPIFTVNKTIDKIVSFESIANLQNMGLFLSGKGPFTTNGVEALLYMRTNLSSIDDVSVPDIEVMQSMVSMSFDTTLASRRAFRLTDATYDSVYKPLQNKRTFQYLVINIHPRSKGYLKLNSTNPQGHPLFYANFLEDERDLESLVLGIREMIRITLQKPFQELGVKIHEAQVPGCEGLKFNTNQYWRCYVMHMTTALHHQVGVCKMGPASDPTTVVDHRLRVHGIRNLRVVDTGIIPATPSGHTSAYAFLIGERAADFIKEDWRYTKDLIELNK